MTRSELQLVPLATASASGRSPSPTRAGRDAAAVVAITALAFLPALRNGFVEFDDQQNRSEEHTSELQSHSDLVCRLLLEKKKKKKKYKRITLSKEDREYTVQHT